MSVQLRSCCGPPNLAQRLSAGTAWYRHTNPMARASVRPIRALFRSFRRGHSGNRRLGIARFMPGAPARSLGRCRRALPSGRASAATGSPYRHLPAGQSWVEIEVPVLSRSCICACSGTHRPSPAQVIQAHLDAPTTKKGGDWRAAAADFSVAPGLLLTFLLFLLPHAVLSFPASFESLSVGKSQVVRYCLAVVHSFTHIRSFSCRSVCCSPGLSSPHEDTSRLHSFRFPVGLQEHNTLAIGADAYILFAYAHRRGTTPTRASSCCLCFRSLKRPRRSIDNTGGFVRLHEQLARDGSRRKRRVGGY